MQDGLEQGVKLRGKSKKSIKGKEKVYSIP
jgi:hypothetical protein